MNVAGQVNLLTAHFCGIDAVDSTALLIKGVLTVGACQQGSMGAGRASAGVRHPAVCGGACRSNATPTVRPGLQSLARLPKQVARLLVVLARLLVVLCCVIRSMLEPMFTVWYRRSEDARFGRDSCAHLVALAWMSGRY